MTYQDLFVHFCGAVGVPASYFALHGGAGWGKGASLLASVPVGLVGGWAAGLALSALAASLFVRRSAAGRGSPPAPPSAQDPGKGRPPDRDPA